MKNLILILCFFAVSVTTQAQNVIEQPFIEINGKAELHVIPNQIFINIYLTENIDKTKYL